MIPSTDIGTLYKENLTPLITRARRAFLRDPEDTAVRAVIRLYEASLAGRLVMTRDSLYLVMSGLVRNELESGAHRLEQLRSPADMATLVERKSLALSHPLSTESWMFRASLLDSLRDMPSGQAGAWLLREVHGWSYPEIGRALDVSKQRASQLCESARRRLVKEVYRYDPS